MIADEPIYSITSKITTTQKSLRPPCLCGSNSRILQTRSPENRPLKKDQRKILVALIGLIAAVAGGGWAVHVALSVQNNSISAMNGGVVNQTATNGGVQGPETSSNTEDKEVLFSTRGQGISTSASPSSNTRPISRSGSGRSPKN